MRVRGFRGGAQRCREVLFRKKGVEGVKRGCEVRCSKRERREVVQRGGALEKCREIAFSVVLFDLH